MIFLFYLLGSLRVFLLLARFQYTFGELSFITSVLYSTLRSNCNIGKGTILINDPIFADVLSDAAVKLHDVRLFFLSLIRRSR